MQEQRRFSGIKRLDGEGFRENFAGNVGIDEYTVPLPREWHVQLTQAWHLEWQWFFEDHPNPTREDIENQCATMMHDYGFLEAVFVRYNFPMYE